MRDSLNPSVYDVASVGSGVLGGIAAMLIIGNLADDLMITFYKQIFPFLQIPWVAHLAVVVIAGATSLMSGIVAIGILPYYKAKHFKWFWFGASFSVWLWSVVVMQSQHLHITFALCMAMLTFYAMLVTLATVAESMRAKRRQIETNDDAEEDTLNH